MHPIIAETARSMPHTLRAVDRDSEVLAALKVLSGFDADLTHECTRAINRLRSLLLQIFPALERVFPGTVFVHTSVHGLHHEALISPLRFRMAKDEQHVLLTAHRIKGNDE